MNGYRRWSTYTQCSFYSEIKKGETMTFPLTGRKAEVITLSEESERGRQASLLVKSKMDINELHFKRETGSQTRNLMFTKKKCEGAGSN